MTNFQGQQNLDRNKVFWSKISRGNWNNCWEFRGAIGNNGYGRFWNGNKIIQAHRFAYESYYGHKIPLGKLVLHKCDNRVCCNPIHLYLGTHLDNMRDMILRGRLVRNPYKSACTKAKFYAGEIWLIRRLKIPIRGYQKRYKYSQKLVAKMFKTTRHTINAIWSSEKYPCKDSYFV